MSVWLVFSNYYFKFLIIFYVFLYILFSQVFLQIFLITIFNF